MTYLIRPARALFARPCRPSMHDTTQAHSTLHLWGRAALWQQAAAPRLSQCPRALRAARSVVGHLVAPFSALPSLTLCPPASASTVRAIRSTPSLPPYLPRPPGPVLPPVSPCPAPHPWLQGLRPPVSLSPSSLYPLGVHRAEHCARQPSHYLSPLLPPGVLSSWYVARTLYRTGYLRVQAA